MPEPKNPGQKKLSSVTTGIIITGIVLILSISLGIILPQFLRVKNLKKTLTEKTITLENQKALFPIYAQANRITDQKFETRLPLVERKPLKRDKIILLTNIFKQMAVRHQMKFSGNSLDMATLNASTDHISIELSLTGELFNFRDYLVSLVKLECFNSIERVRILADQTENRQFIINIIINIDKKITDE